MALVLEALQSPERDTPDYITVDGKAHGRHLRPRPGTGRSAVPGEDGTEPGHRILRVLTGAGLRHEFAKAPERSGAFCFVRRLWREWADESTPVRPGRPGALGCATAPRRRAPRRASAARRATPADRWRSWSRSTPPTPGATRSPSGWRPTAARPRRTSPSIVERRGEAVTLAFGRKRIDTCKSFAMGSADLTFTWAELGVRAAHAGVPAQSADRLDLRQVAVRRRCRHPRARRDPGADRAATCTPWPRTGG